MLYTHIKIRFWDMTNGVCFLWWDDNCCCLELLLNFMWECCFNDCYMPLILLYLNNCLVVTYTYGYISHLSILLVLYIASEWHASGNPNEYMQLLNDACFQAWHINEINTWLLLLLMRHVFKHLNEGRIYIMHALLLIINGCTWLVLIDILLLVPIYFNLN